MNSDRETDYSEDDDVKAPTKEDLLEAKKDFSKFVKGMTEDRYKFFGTYKVDKWIIQSCMLLVFAYLFFVAYHYDYTLDYLKCSGPEWSANKTDWDIREMCKNPFFKKDQAWKYAEYLPPGEYGRPPGALFNWAWPVVFITFGVGVGLNHLLHNRRTRAD